MLKEYPQQLISLEAEGGVLGSIILERQKVKVAENILPSGRYFAKSEHEILYDLFLELNREKNAGWDVIIFRDALTRKNQLAAVGGVEYLVELANTVPSAANCAYYADIVYKRHLRRKLYDFGESIKHQTLSESDTESLISNAASDLREVTDGEFKSDSMSFLLDFIDDVPLECKDEYLRTGREGFDELIGGFGKGHFVVVAGRPSMGKTTFLLCLVKHILKEKHPVAFFSLEMTKTDLIQKLIYSESGSIPMSACYRSFVSDNQRMQLEFIREKLKSYPLVIDDGRYLTPQKLRNHIHVLKQTQGIEAVFIDYLQLLRCDKKFNSNYEEVTYLSSELKSMAMEYEIPVICACQLNRAVESRTDKTPRMSDLRGSGAIEQDADAVLMLHRPPYYNTKEYNELNNIDLHDAKIIVAKNRRGMTDSIDTQFYGEYSRYEF